METESQTTKIYLYQSLVSKFLKNNFTRKRFEVAKGTFRQQSLKVK